MASPLVTTVTLNPTVDMSSEAEQVRPTHKIRTTNERLAPGGGGINVARVLQRLEVPVEALYLAGGASGAVLDDLLTRIGLPRRKIAIEGETRLSHTVFERCSGLEFRFVPEGPCASDEELEALANQLIDCPGPWVVLSGSLPRCAPDDLYARLVDCLRGRGCRIALDSSGSELSLAVEGGDLELIKPSRSELEHLAGGALPTQADMARAARSIVMSGKVRMVAVTLGQDGALLVTPEGAWSLPAVPVETRSAVGAGDSFLAAMIAALAQGERPTDAFRHGTAAGAATASTPGTDLCRREEIAARLPAVGEPKPLSL
jgi:6-phosphofructokinase 2